MRSLFRSYQRAIIHCQTLSVARGERNAHISVLAPRLNLFYSLLTIVLWTTSSASSEDTPSTHEIGRTSAEVFSDVDEFSLLQRGSCGVTMSSCLFALVCLFFLRCMVEMLVNAGQEMDSARDCKYKFSINLVKKKPEYRKNPVNYPFGIQFILLFSMPKNSQA